MSRYLCSAFLVTTFSLTSFSALAAKPKSVAYPEEVAALMSGPRFNVLIQRLRRSLPPGHQVRIQGARVEPLGSKTYVYVRIDKQNAVEPIGSREELGEVVGEVKPGSQGTEIGEIFFKPRADADTLPKY